MKQVVESWIKPEITVGNLLTVCGMLFIALTTYMTLQNRVGNNTSDIGKLNEEVKILRARDDSLLTQITALQRETLVELTRLRAQLELLTKTKEPQR